MVHALLIISFKITVLVVPKKKIVKVLTIYGHGGHLGHVTETIFINLCPSFPRWLHVKFDFDMQSCFKEKDV